MIAIEFTGALHSGAYHSTDTGAYGGITVNRNGSAWIATPTPGSISGSFTVTVTTVTTVLTSATGTAYLVHGTIDATLPAISGAGAGATPIAITLKATF